MSTATQRVRITEKVLRAYFNCVRKSYLLMFSREQSKPTEYALIMEYRKGLVRANYLDGRILETVNLDQTSWPIHPMMLNGIAASTISSDILSTESAIFKIVPGTKDFGDFRYEPVIFTTSHTLHQDDKLEVCFAGYVLSKIQDKPPLKGKVILLDARETNVRLLDGINRIVPVINLLERWGNSQPESPTVILNKHCPYCEFQHLCRPIAEKEDSISLLGRVSVKDLNRYEKKGIFTIKQLSFLYRPKKQNRRFKLHPAAHKYELQALALRTGNIYLYGEAVAIPRADTEIFFDIEAVPDSNFNYLIGVMVHASGTSQSFQFWADSQTDEASIWNDFVALINHYGPSLICLDQQTGASQKRSVGTQIFTGGVSFSLTSSSNTNNP